MSDETRREIIKAFAYGMDEEEIANFAEITKDEAINFEIDNQSEIREEKVKLGVTL